ncbi:helicase associated domain-containing protein [Arthrobacter sp. zg-Y1110]|uniref:helicase associated domain-containing protein n=1 Tax=Arthrobacter sp. zg-Y1110 TaxID=2886932 RepID=UPI001D140A42|nr:helicase associated domain-containing protein [Arthrobacter sp. zg-Y1110]MCC3292842.1 helicase associated domain-containing protein [Arthrobacter sp. zg-Y1110]UWX86781.1 helicase associated domain-containing protein [Arthrobacter sp. zg-Y1110]
MTNLDLPTVKGRTADAPMAGAVAEFTGLHARLPGPGEPELHSWLERKRRAARKGRLNASLGAWLNENVPGWRLSREDRWNENLSAAAASRITGTTTAAQKSWLGAQRRAAAAGTLTPERRRALGAALGDWLEAPVRRPATWDERADDVTDFVDLHSRLPMPSGLDDEASLSRWLAHQRAQARAGRLSSTRMSRLDKDAAGWLPLAEGRDFPWRAQARTLAGFVAANSRWPLPSVPAEAELAKWARSQRTSHRAGRLNEDRTARLAAIPGWPDAVVAKGGAI